MVSLACLRQAGVLRLSVDPDVAWRFPPVATAPGRSNEDGWRGLAMVFVPAGEFMMGRIRTLLSE